MEKILHPSKTKVLLRSNVLDRLYSVVVITPDFDSRRKFRQPQFESGYDLKERIDLHF